MLRQILRDMWVEPELLAELDEEQRLSLFCHMRAEQVRRWAEREKTLPPPPTHPRPPPKPGAKRVDWLLGADGHPWVWVMGDHPDDLPTSLHTSSEASQCSEGLHHAGAERHKPSPAPATPGQMQHAAQSHFDLQSNKQQKAAEQVNVDNEFLQQSAEEGIYCTVDELRAVAAAAAAAAGAGTVGAVALRPAPDAVSATPVERRGAPLQEISLNNNNTTTAPDLRPDKVWQRVALWERRVAEERGVPLRRRRPPSDHSTDHLAADHDHNHMMQAVTLRRFTPDEQQEELAWREQERRAKEAEQQIREIARRAREEHRRTSEILAMEVDSSASALSSSADAVAAAATHNVLIGNDSLNNNSINNASPAPSTAKPPSTEAVVEWFRSSEVARHAGLAPGTNLVATWFHGLISRQEAEQRLESAPEGSFLVRVSERVWGYAISYRAPERCKHFLIDASSGQYQFLGAHQNTHSSLGELVEYHSRNPITLLGGEMLLHPCARSEVPSIFQGLLTPSMRR